MKKYRYQNQPLKDFEGTARGYFALKLTLIVLFPLFLSSCRINNHLTSPEILPEEEAQVSISLIGFPELGADKDRSIDNPIIFEPVVSYRMGTEYEGEFGVTFYPLGPAIQLNYKHLWVQSGKIFLSGNITGALGFFRPSGFSYNLLFGNRSIYGVTGIAYHSARYREHDLTLNLGLGTEFGRKTGIGLQLGYSHSLNPDLEQMEVEVPRLTLGVKYDIVYTKRKFRKAGKYPR